MSKETARPGAWGIALALPAILALGIGIAIAATPEEERRKKEQEQRAAHERQRQAEQQRQREAQERQRQAEQQRQRDAQERQRKEMARQQELQRQRDAQRQAPPPQATPQQPALRQAPPQAARQASPVVTPIPSPAPQSPSGFATPGAVPQAPRPVPVSAPPSTPVSSGYAAAPAGAGMPRYADGVNNCVHSESRDGRFVLTNQCREGISLMYCLRPGNEPARCTSANQMSFRALEPRGTAQEFSRQAASIHWYACRDGYKPEFTEWTGDRFRGRCVLSDDISLLRDWHPMATSAYGGSPVVDVCINDTQCEDGDILAVSVNGREVMREEIFNRPSCRRVPVNSGNNVISIYAVNGTGYKGKCNFANRNTGQIAVHPVSASGERQSPQSQSWNVPGGAGSSSSMVISVR